jgi:hypothetical protein
MRSHLETTLRNVLWFKRAHDADELVLKPPFQRNPVWVTRQKSFLIDTILQNYPIPEIYMQEQIEDGTNPKYILVDGQQRIRAVLEFLEGRFAIDGRDSPAWADQMFDDLTPEERDQILRYNFVVRILPDIEDTEIRTIFQRLNRNVLALNRQELRQATYWGPFITMMNKLSDRKIWRQISIFTPNDIRRMLDVEFISELAAALLHGPQDKKKNLDKYYRLYEEEFDQGEFVQETFRSVLSEIVAVLPNINKTRWRKKTDFYTLFLVFANHVEALPLSRGARASAAESLIGFAREIDLFVKAVPDKAESFSALVRHYGAGIRASTDLGSRIRREEALEELLTQVWDE